jgi:NADH-quinone oxidoreductase subunit L
MPGVLQLLWLVPGLPLAGFVANGVLALRRPQAKRVVSVIGVGVLVAALALSVAIVLALPRAGAAGAAGPLVFRYWEWMPVGDLQVAVALQLDQLSAVMLLVVTGVGSLIHLFSVGYMGEDPGYARYFAYLNLFVFFMLVLVLGASFPVMFVGWEGVGLCSYLLIGFWFNEKINADAGKKAFIVNRIGDFGFLVAMLLIFAHTGSLDFAPVFARAPTLFAPGGAAITAITLFLFLGCTGKSAQIPLYTWLPDAMQGPTPVSALIHAATMVTAGVYLVARCNVLYALSPVSSAVVAGIGALTALFAATIALKQWDIKRVLAYSTVSQLGYMFLGVGSGAHAAGIFHLVTHAFFKALLFLGAGSVIYAVHHAYHATHSHEDAQDMRNMGGLARFLPGTSTLMWIATLAIAGIPPFAGFFSKDAILGAAFSLGDLHPLWYGYWLLGLLTALLTAFYMTRLMLYTFHGPNRTGERESAHLHEAPWVMTGPLVVLGALSLAGGALDVPALFHGGALLERWLAPVTDPATRLGPAGELSHGTEWALVAVAVAVAALGIFGAMRLLRPEALVPARLAPAERGFGRVLWKKWYVDEIYDLLFVRPVVWLSREVLWKTIDQRLVDGVGVNGAARASRALGWIGSRLQTGQLGFYVVLFVGGALAVLWTAVR